MRKIKNIRHSDPRPHLRNELRNADEKMDKKQYTPAAGNGPDGGTGSGPDFGIEGSPCAGFHDNFVGRLINRSLDRRIYYDSPVSDELAAWGAMTDTTHDWRVVQYQTAGYDIGAGLGATSDQGYAGVAGNQGFMRWDDDSAPNWSFAFLAPNTVPLLTDSADWVFEGVFTMKRGGSAPDKRIDIDIYAPDALVTMGFRFQPDFPYSEIRLSEAWSDTYTTPSITFSWDIKYHIKWEHSVTNNVARLKVWQEGTSEPGWQITMDAYDYRPDLIAGLRENSTDPTVHLPDYWDFLWGPNSATDPGSSSGEFDWVGVYWDYLLSSDPDDPSSSGIDGPCGGDIVSLSGLYVTQGIFGDRETNAAVIPGILATLTRVSSTLYDLPTDALYVKNIYIDGVQLSGSMWNFDFNSGNRIVFLTSIPSTAVVTARYVPDFNA